METNGRDNSHKEELFPSLWVYAPRLKTTGRASAWAEQSRTEQVGRAGAHAMGPQGPSVKDEQQPTLWLVLGVLTG